MGQNMLTVSSVEEPDPSKERGPGYDTDVEALVLGSVEYPFIVITPGSLWSRVVIDPFKNHSYLISPCKKKTKKKQKQKTHTHTHTHTHFNMLLKSTIYIYIYIYKNK